MRAEDVIAMLLSVLIAGMVAALALTFWPAGRGGPSAPATGPGPVSAVRLPTAPSPVPPPPVVHPPVAPSSPVMQPPPIAMQSPPVSSAEGLLSARLLGGELTPEQYHGAMAGLAAREEARDPMRLPGEIGPAAD
ncbi:hypothetical protein [Actinoplanes sp. HUAS TT8]|uniref:hypothetical protein n=1 Tax=Actinoplanes sp. HUAS TT8 TaxID=3447453 RepID=UPI003F51D567